MNILFITAHPWDAIKQRPYFMAKYLDEREGNAVTFVSFFSFGGGYVKNDDRLKKKPVVLPRLPFVRFRLIRFINITIAKMLLRPYFAKNDVVIMTDPSHCNLALKTKLPVVYDCMDDWVAYEKRDAHKGRVFQNERALIKKAALVLFSSRYLQQVVTKRAGIPCKSIVLNNAIHIPPRASAPDTDFGKKFRTPGKRNIAYIGAIFNWFDYDLIRQIAVQNSNAHFNLFGPANGSFPHEDNITFWGVQEHKNIFSIMEHQDALIMPFKLNDLILSVNPIKLYEYIYSGKPVIAIKYGETLCFEDYAYLYEAGNSASLEEVLRALEKNGYAPKKPLSEMRAFALENTWEKRVNTLQSSLDASLQ